MKALTITSNAQRSTQSTAKLRSFAKYLTNVLFSERVATVVSCAGAAAGFFFAVADQPRSCALIIAIALPWFMSLLAQKGGDA